MTNRNEDVDGFLKSLKHPLKMEIEKLRAIMLASNKQITEHIKWNAPSFCFQGEDRVTFNLRAKVGLQLVFHRGAKVRDDQDFVYKDGSGLLEWVSKDRALVKLQDMQDMKAKEGALTKAVNQWMKSTASESATPESNRKNPRGKTRESKKNANREKK